MGTNSFDGTDREFYVLVNGEGQYSLWPSFAEIPAGWSVALREADRQSAIDYVNEHWTDRRPESRRANLAASQGAVA